MKMIDKREAGLGVAFIIYSCDGSLNQNIQH
jgi:hypothetical protein